MESDLDRLDLAAPTGRTAANVGSDPVATYSIGSEQYQDARGKLRTKSKNAHLTVENHGAAAAVNFTFVLTSLDGRSVPRILDDNITPTIPAKGHYAWPVLGMMGTASNVEMAMTWQEDGAERGRIQSVSLS